MINAAVDLKLIKAEGLCCVIVDKTLQERAIAHPTDSKLLETARGKLMEAARDHGILLKQRFVREGRSLGFRVGRYAHGRQYRRVKRMIERQRAILGRFRRKMATPKSSLEATLARKPSIRSNSPDRAKSFRAQLSSIAGMRQKFSASTRARAEDRTSSVQKSASRSRQRATSSWVRASSTEITTMDTPCTRRWSKWTC